MDESKAVVKRLTRIDALERGGAAPLEILAELRLLVGEAEAWARREGDERAKSAAAGVRAALQHDMIPL